MKLSEYKNIIFATSTKTDGNLSFLHGDTEAVLRNRDRFLEKYDLQLGQCAVMSIEHSDTVVAVTEEDRGRGATSKVGAIAAEALVTDRAAIVLFLLTADCFPLAFYDPQRRVIALAHLGWKPTDLRLAQKVVRAFTAIGSEPADLVVEFGPGIQKGSYIVDGVTQADSPDWQPYLERMAEDKIAIDLLGYNVAQLKESGIHEENISFTKIDTATSPEHFSHYREARTGEETGRFATIFAMR